MIATIITIIWCLLGLAACIREHYTHKKYFWECYKCNHNTLSSTRFLFYVSPILILGGAITLFLSETSSAGIYGRKERVWYFKIPKT